jgi:hypothetical protein
MARKNDGASANPNTSTAALSNRNSTGRSARTKLMRHWADRIDHWLDPACAYPSCTETA